MLNYEALIEKYCDDNADLQNTLLVHSKMVAEMALRLARKHLELNVDETFLYEAAMLHDIGIVKTNAPAIHCHGTEPYLRHGLLGGEILRSEGLPRHARVAERHTGTGLTVESIVKQHLPLPPQDFIPETIEEQLICYADKFYSKTHLEKEKTFEQAKRSLEKFGEEGLAIFQRWYGLFGM